MSFDEMNLKENLLRGIYSYGFEEPSEIQKRSIPHFSSGKDMIAQAQSGTGKTGAFSIGSLNNIDEDLEKTQCIILSPTRELAEQTYLFIKEISKYTKITCEKIVGGTNVRECQQLLEKNPHMVIGTPGRIIDMIQRNSLYTDGIKNFVVDEADEMLSQGFIDSIREIFNYIPKISIVYLFSATIPEEILDLSDKFMDNPEKILVKKENLTLEGISQYYINVKRHSWKLDTMIDIYGSINISQCIIYVNQKQRLIELAQRLNEMNYPVGCIHGDLRTQEREETINSFRSGDIRILLSTDLLSRGIDVQQLSLVINYDLPINKETYIHRIGRSGRYGRKGVAINFVTDRDFNELEELQRFYDTKIDEMPQDIERIVQV
jgi:superfamily II DNA/RNA helicase